MGKFLKQYEILFKKAKSDLELAKYALDGFTNDKLEIELDVIAFHLQQSAEKLLKSLLDYYKIKFPKTHDLENLISIIDEKNISVNTDLSGLIYLNDYAVEGRYAVIHDDLDNIQIYIDLIDTLKSEVDKLIHQIKRK